MFLSDEDVNKLKGKRVKERKKGKKSAEKFIEQLKENEGKRWGNFESIMTNLRVEPLKEIQKQVGKWLEEINGDKDRHNSNPFVFGFMEVCQEVYKQVTGEKLEIVERIDPSKKTEWEKTMEEKAPDLY